LDTPSFPFGTARSVMIGGRAVLAVRLTYVGELGWELHVPAMDLPAVQAALWAAGADLGVANAGHYAVNSLRLEKGYRAYGAELSPDETPLEAGLGFTVAWDKPGGFNGREALLARRQAPLAKRLAQFVLEDPEPVLWGAEPILRNGEPVGYTTSGAYGHTLGAAVGLGYVKVPGGGAATAEFVAAGRYEVLVLGKAVPARVHLKTPLDPERRRILV
jgi:sarcosine dehydrogenase